MRTVQLEDMGHSFHIDQEPFPKITQPLYLTVPETRRLHIPRSPISDATEDVALIKSYLENKPQELLYRKRLSAISRAGTQSIKKSLDIFHLSSSRFKYLLRPSSAPPAPAPSTNFTYKETESGDYSSQTPWEIGINRTTIDTPASVPGRGAEKLKLSMPLSGGGDDSGEELSERADLTGPRQGYTDSSRPQLQRMESGTYDIVRDIPYLAPSTVERFPRQYEPIQIRRGQRALPTNVRQEAEHNGHNLQSHRTPLVSKAPILDSVGCRNNATTSVNFDSAHNTDKNLQATSTSEDLNIGQESSITTALPDINNRGQTHELHKLSSSLIMHVDSWELPRTSNIRSPMAMGSPKNPTPSKPSCGNTGSTSPHISPRMEPFILSPAPDLPLPPLPEQGSSLYSLLRNARDPSKEHNKSPASSGPLQFTVPPKSPARYRNTDTASQDMQPSGFNSIRVSPTKKKKLLMNRKTSFEGSSEVSTSFPKPADQALESEDPFIWRKKRNLRTQELKKRHLLQSRIQPKTSCQADKSPSITSKVGEDTDDTIELPSVIISNRAHDTSKNSNTNAGHYNKPYQPENLASSDSEDQAATQRTSSTNMPSHYRDHSTQYAVPGAYLPKAPASLVLPPVIQSAMEASDHPKSVPCASCEQRRSSGRKTHSPLHVTCEGPETLPSCLGDLEDRLEARLGAFERRTVLLEAALLAVINASANYDPTISCRAGKRLSGMSGRSEASAPIGSNSEAIIADMKGNNGR